MSNGGLAAILCGGVLVGTGIGAVSILTGGETRGPDAKLVGALATVEAPMVVDNDDDDEDDEHDITITLEEVSDAARATILEYASDGEITEIEMSNWRGEIIYEIEVYWDDTETEFMVAHDGTFLGREEED